jgi:anti-anti-sigma regulatory factor
MAPDLIRSDLESSAATLVREALGRLSSAGGALTLDFSAVRRLDPAAVRLIQELAAQARAQSVHVILGGVNAAVYKALKLSGLASEFSFLP